MGGAFAIFEFGKVISSLFKAFDPMTDSQAAAREFLFEWFPVFINLKEIVWRRLLILEEWEF